VKITGYIGKSTINRGNRNFENYFINGRYIKNYIITKAIEDAFKPYMMQHKYPFTSLYYEITPSLLDVNVHPQKLELKLTNQDDIYKITHNMIKDILSGKELIPKVSLSNENKNDNKIEYSNKLPEPFEKNRMSQLKALETMAMGSNNIIRETNRYLESTNTLQDGGSSTDKGELDRPKKNSSITEQINLFSDKVDSEATPFISKQALSKHRIIGQVFSTYWLVEFNKELYIIDQHAAHEKVLYERIIATARDNKHSSQMLMPPIVLTLSLREQQAIKDNEGILNKLGYEVEHFGGNEFSIRAVPADLYNLADKDLFLEFIDELTSEVASRKLNPESILEKTASMACKAAVKANHAFSIDEATSLIKELLSLENPYHCPHGRPVIISMSQYELEKKFKRIL
jgi:DNA mismatch repair protein MutL